MPDTLSGTSSLLACGGLCNRRWHVIDAFHLFSALLFTTPLRGVHIFHYLLKPATISLKRHHIIGAEPPPAHLIYTDTDGSPAKIRYQERGY